MRAVQPATPRSSNLGISRLGIAVLLAVLLAGCATVRTLPPPGLIATHRLTVFTDGFHSGILLDRQALPAGFDPRSGDEPASYPYLTLHFGEELWTSGVDDSLLHAVRLAFVPGRGVIQSDHTRAKLIDVPGLHLEHLRTWEFQVNQAGIDHLLHHLRGAWQAPGIYVRETDEVSTLYRSQRTWGLFHNCHDFTIDMVRAAGLDLRGRWLYIGGSVAQDMEAAERAMAEARRTVIGFAPDEGPVQSAAASAAATPAP